MWWVGGEMVGEMVNCVVNMVREVKLDMLEENIVPEKSATPFAACANTGCVNCRLLLFIIIIIVLCDNLTSKFIKKKK